MVSRGISAATIPQFYGQEGGNDRASIRIHPAAATSPAVAEYPILPSAFARLPIGRRNGRKSLPHRYFRYRDQARSGQGGESWQAAARRRLRRPKTSACRVCGALFAALRGFPRIDRLSTRFVGLARLHPPWCRPRRTSMSVGPSFIRRGRKDSDSRPTCQPCCRSFFKGQALIRWCHMSTSWAAGAVCLWRWLCFRQRDVLTPKTRRFWRFGRGLCPRAGWMRWVLAGEGRWASADAG